MNIELILPVSAYKIYVHNFVLIFVRNMQIFFIPEFLFRWKPFKHHYQWSEMYWTRNQPDRMPVRIAGKSIVSWKGREHSWCSLRHRLVLVVGKIPA